MDHSIRLGFVSLLFLSFLPSFCAGQSFDFKVRPDLWYNSIDGARIGLQFNGATTTDFGEDDHVLNVGIWYGSKGPENPLSYYFSFTEGLSGISSYGNEATIELISSVRTGLSEHGAIFSKRFQPAFDEDKYKKVSVGLTYENQYDLRYIALQAIQFQPKSMLAIGFEQYSVNSAGAFRFINSFKHNFNSASGTFSSFQSEVNQQFSFGKFKLNTRGFFGFINSLEVPEYAFPLSTPPIADYNNTGLSRARGTIPQSWYEIGTVQIAGGANLRGYLEQSLERLTGFPIQATTKSIAAINVDLDFPNPLSNKIQQTSILKDITQFRSYVFIDAGLPGDVRDLSRSTLPVNPPATPFPDELIMDGGIGFTIDLNIPDFQGNRRGFVIRYEMPFWVSSPLVGDDSFKFRQVIGFGGIFTF